MWGGGAMRPICVSGEGTHRDHEILIAKRTPSEAAVSALAPKQGTSSEDFPLSATPFHFFSPLCSRLGIGDGRRWQAAVERFGGSWNGAAGCGVPRRSRDCSSTHEKVRAAHTRSSHLATRPGGIRAHTSRARPKSIKRYENLRSPSPYSSRALRRRQKPNAKEAGHRPPWPP
jgi:hypothetical protein